MVSYPIIYCKMYTINYTLKKGSLKTKQYRFKPARCPTKNLGFVSDTKNRLRKNFLITNLKIPVLLTQHKIKTILNIRVWSWLRMNAGGVPNTCKSSDWEAGVGSWEVRNESWEMGFKMLYFYRQVPHLTSHISHLIFHIPPLNSGGWVSNAWATYPIQGDNNGKPLLIPHNTFWWHHHQVKEIRYRMGPRLIS